MAQVETGEAFSEGHHSPVHRSLSRIEMPSILFFLGILMAVAALESLGILFNFAGSLQDTMPMLGTELHGEGSRCDEEVFPKCCENNRGARAEVDA